MSVESIGKLINSLDSGQETESFEVEYAENGITTYVSGDIYRHFVESVGGTYYEDKEYIWEEISKEVYVENVVSYDEDGNEAPPAYDRYEIMNHLNNKNHARKN